MLRPFARLQTAGQHKPQGVPQIDWTHPLAQGLLFYGFDTGMGLILDLVAGRPMNMVGTITGQGSSQVGTGITYNSTVSTNFSADSIIRAATAAPPWTAATGYYLIQGHQNSVPFGRTANNGSAPAFNWGFQTQNTVNGTNMRGFLNSGGVGTLIGSQTSGLGLAFNSLALVANSSSSASFFANGVQSGVTTTGLTIQSADTNDAICFGGNSSASAANAMTSAFVFYGAFWGRALSTNELVLLHNDPYCFLTSAEGEMPVVFLPPASSFLAAWALGSNLPVIGTGNY